MFVTILYIHLCSFLVLASSQNECERLVITDLGSTGAPDTIGLISEILTPEGEYSKDRQPTVTVLNMNIVCEAQALTQDRYRYTSVVTTFTCFSTDVRVTECQDHNITNTQQFDFGCLNGMWSRHILTVTSHARTSNPRATLRTEKDSQCSYCLNPSHPAIDTFNWTVSVETHCKSMLFIFRSPFHMLTLCRMF